MICDLSSRHREHMLMNIEVTEPSGTLSEWDLHKWKHRSEVLRRETHMSYTSKKQFKRLCIFSESLLICYWLGWCPDDHRSTRRFVMYLSSNLILWTWLLPNKTVSRSSTESKYKALANRVIELTWLQVLFVIWCDNLWSTYLG